MIKYMRLTRFAAGLLSVLAAGPVAPRLQAQTVEPCGAYVDAFGRGLDAYNAGARDVARAAWGEVVAVEGCGPDVAYNLAVLAVIADDLGGAETLYATALTRLDAWPDSVQVLAEGRRMRAGLYTGLLNVGARRFVAEDYAAALGAFTRIATRDSLHRDAWYNAALALYKLERWRDLIPAAERVIVLDPLNHNAHLLLFNAHREIGEAARARGDVRTLRRARAAAEAAREEAEGLPVRVENVQIATEGDMQTLRARLLPGQAAAGTAVRLAVTLMGPHGPLAVRDVDLVAPATGAPTMLEVVFDNAPGATTVRYRIVRVSGR